MKNVNINRRTCTTLAVASSLSLLAACSSSEDNMVGMSSPMQAPTPDFCNADTPPDAQAPDTPLSGDDTISYGYVFTRGPSFESGQIERISLTDGNVVDGMYPATKSDHGLATDGASVFQIGRFEIDTLTSFSPVDTSIVQYELSLLTPGASTTNPQSLVPVDDNFAYLTRRGSDSLLVVDPSPELLTTEALIRGEISLAAYNRGSGPTLDLPDMTDAVLVDDMLFVLLENLDGFDPVERGYVAVFDVCTNLEIPTGQGESPLQGIQLQTVNPVSLQYNETTGLLYVAGRGDAFANPPEPGVDPYTGGVESIDPSTFETQLLIDDGTAADNNGFYLEVLVLNSTLGYAIMFDGFDTDFNSLVSLRTFNPETAEVSEPIPGTEGLSLTTLALGPDNHVWVGIQDNAPGFIRIDVATGIPAQERVRTNLIPADVLFLEVDR